MAGQMGMVADMFGIVRARNHLDPHAPQVLERGKQLVQFRAGKSVAARMSDDGVAFVPHLDACFLLVDEFERLVFTNAVDSAWRPADPAPISMTAEVTMRDHPEGTEYRIIARHGDPAARDRHAKMGFADGWGTVAAQLARYAETAR